jgi:phosphonate transport system substrate-binding protein
MQMVDLVSAASPWQIDFVDGDDDVLRRMVRAGESEFAWVCGLLHVGRKDPSAWPYRVIAAPVMTGDRYRSQPIYYGDVIVRSDSPAKGLEDATDGVWAYNEQSSFSGFHMARHDLDVEPDSRSVASGSHIDSLRMVISGEADWAVIDSTVCDMDTARGARLMSGVRVIGSIGPYPMPPFIARADLKEEVVRDVVRTLTGMHETAAGRELFAKYHVDRIVAFNEADYDPIRRIGITVD